MKITVPKTALINAETMAAEHPDAFEIEDRAVREAVKIGDSIKVAAAKERFWVTVVDKTETGEFLGCVDNVLVGTHEHGLQYQDVIVFGPEHIYAIF